MNPEENLVSPEKPLKKPRKNSKTRVVPIRIVKEKKKRVSKKKEVKKKNVEPSVQETPVAIPAYEFVLPVSASEPQSSKRKALRALLLINIIGVIGIALMVFYIYNEPVVQEVESHTAPMIDSAIITGEVSSSTPQTLIIPAIDLSAHVVPVGKTKTGTMNVPADFENVGWYKYGALPGRIGNAVIDGHFDNGKGEPAVFTNLAKLRIGDDVFVINKDGQKIQFVVREIALVDIEDLSSERIFGETDGQHLNLITCDGVWLPDRKTYTQRLVVFTDRVGGTSH